MTDLDELMSRLDEVGWDKALPDDIDTVIAYQRKQRALREGGVKPKRGQNDGPSKPLDLVALGLIKPSAPVKRRV